MINSGMLEKRSVYLRVLSDDQIWEIKRSALDVMQNVGFKVLHAGARKMLKQSIPSVRCAGIPERCAPPP